jgi:surface antigen
MKPVAASFGGGTKLGGIVVSPVVGGKIGSRLDLYDNACATAGLELAPTGKLVSWQSGAGIPLSFQATRSYTLSDGQPCREFSVTATVAGHKETVRGTACRSNETGGWQRIG